jgi:ribosome-associated translation inhibitor RaiA
VKIEIRTRGLSPDPGLRLFVERRLEFALDRFADKIARVRVVLGDLNGPRGGVDKSCRIEVHLPGRRAVRAAVVDADAYAAIAAAAHRVAQGVARAVERGQATTSEPAWPARGSSTAA